MSQARRKKKLKIKAIDISYAQQDVDFSKIKKAGIKAVIIRNGYLNKTDTCFKKHMRGAIAAGLDIGTYTYIMSNTVEEAKKEAQQTITRLKPYRGYINYPVFCDMESEKYYSDKFNNRLRTDIILTFCEEIKKSGYYAALYINPSWLEEWTNKVELLRKYDIWLAAWTEDPNKATKYDYGQTMWQWGKDRISGINGPVDGNIVYIDYPLKIKTAGMNYLPDKIASKKKVSDIYESCGTAAMRTSYHKGQDNIVSRCEKGKLYPIDGTITVNGIKWLCHADKVAYSMYKDELILFKKVGTYSKFKTTTRLNVRSRPELNQRNILGILESGDWVYATGSDDNGWTPCVYKGQKAYVSSQYIKEV